MAQESDVPDDEMLWRRVDYDNPSMMRCDSATKEEIGPSSAAFKPHEDGTSVYIRRILEGYRIDASGVVVKPEQAIWELGVKSVREVDLDVHTDAWPQDIPDPEHERNAAHALIVGWEGLGRREISRKAGALARQATCIHDPRDPNEA